jgi:hypothetical protein
VSGFEQTVVMVVLGDIKGKSWKGGNGSTERRGGIQY